MRSLIIVTLSMLSFSAFAKSDLSAKCETQAVAAAVKANKKKFGAETSDCGAKLLHLGDQLETYLVCVSDETDPSEWIVTVKRDVFSKRTHKVVGTCDVEYTGYAVDASTPDFE